MASELSNVHGTWDKKTRNAFLTKPRPGHVIDGRIDTTSLSTNKSLVVLEREPPSITESFHIDSPVLTNTPDNTLILSSTNKLLTTNVEKEHPNVRIDLSSKLYSILASTIDLVISPVEADLITAISATVVIGVITAEPIKAGRTHVAHFPKRDGMIMIIIILGVLFDDQYIYFGARNLKTNKDCEPFVPQMEPSY